MHEPSVLFHVSEDAGIERFDPRASASSSADAPPRPRSRQALGIPRSTDPHGSSDGAFVVPSRPLVSRDSTYPGKWRTVLRVL